MLAWGKESTLRGSAEERANRGASEGDYGRIERLQLLHGWQEVPKTDWLEWEKVVGVALDVLGWKEAKKFQGFDSGASN